LVAACSGQDTGLLDLTLSAEATNPPPRGVEVDLIGSGGIHRSYPGTFPPDGAAFLRLEYPDLPTGSISFTVQTLDAKGCVLGESPAPFVVAIKAGAKAIAATTVQRSTKPCGDGGGQAQGPDAGVEVGLDTGYGDETGAFDTNLRTVDSPVEAAMAMETAMPVEMGVDAPVLDAPVVDPSALDARPVDLPSADGPTGLSSQDSSPIVNPLL
jgi:hypothetical protein